jgi:hypothetical protein
MKRVLLSTFIGVLSLAATAQNAQTGQTEQGTSVQVPGYPIELPTTIHRAAAGDFAQFRGAYELSNGDTMVLRSEGHRMFAVVGDRPQVELVAAASNVFVGVDKQLKMTLEEQASGPIKGELLIAMPGQPTQVAAIGVAGASLVAGR